MASCGPPARGIAEPALAGLFQNEPSWPTARVLHGVFSSFWSPGVENTSALPHCQHNLIGNAIQRDAGGVTKAKVVSQFTGISSGDKLSGSNCGQ